MSSALVALHQLKDDVVWPNRPSLQVLLHGHHSSKPHAALKTLEAILVEAVQPMPNIDDLTNRPKLALRRMAVPPRAMAIRESRKGRHR
jgi:hypothetical protein